MKFVIHLVVVLHLLGMAAILSGWIAQRYGAKAWAPLVWGARAQVLTGLLLVGRHEMADDDLNHMKIGVKVLVAIGVAACAEIANAKAKRGDLRPVLVNVAAALTILNVLVAALWK